MAFIEFIIKPNTTAMQPLQNITNMPLPSHNSPKRYSYIIRLLKKSHISWRHLRTGSLPTRLDRDPREYVQKYALLA